MGEPSAASYIRKVQHLIETCLQFKMSKEECVEAISKHANINPVITSTVWKELEKENIDYFEAYMREQQERALEKEAMERVNKMLEEFTTRDPNDE